MPVEVLTKEDLNQFRQQLLDDLKKIIQQRNPPPKEWLKSSEVRKLLRISSGALQTLRLKGNIRVAKIGSILLYKTDDIDKFLNDNMS